jgi:lysophospholipase L1-like esterase
MKRILCYGDSNTWGYDPATGSRFDEPVRWTGVLAAALGPDYAVIEEGLNGRTTVCDDPVEGAHKNGRAYLLPCLESQAPLDLVIVMLGTNDLKQRFALPAADIAQGAGTLVRLVQQSDSGREGCAPKVLLIAPITVGAEIREGEVGQSLLGQSFGPDSHPRSLQFADYFQLVAEALGCEFLNAADHASASPGDAIHLESADHHQLGLAIAGKVQALLDQQN